MKTRCRGCKNVIHANRDNSVKGMNSDLALGLFSPIQVSETHDTTGLSHPSHYLPYLHYIHYIRITPPTFVKNLHRPLSEETAPLKPTCDEEAEALKGAPPCEGFWLEPPTLHQRIRQWTDYGAHQLRKLTNDR